MAKPGAVVGTSLNVNFSTSSDDEVFDDLDDSWSYRINSAPSANNRTAKTYTEKLTPITLTGSDPNGERLSYRIVTQPAHGKFLQDLQKMRSEKTSLHAGRNLYDYQIY